MTEATEAVGPVDDVDETIPTIIARIRARLDGAEDASTKGARTELAAGVEEDLHRVEELLEVLETPPAPLELGEVNGPEGALVAALARAQAEFPPIAKNKTATVNPRDKPGYTYQYADLADVLTAVRPALARNGLAVTQQTRHRQPDGRVELITTIRHVGGAALVSEVELGQSPGNPQQFGGALTYLRRYELTTLVGVAAEEDRDAQDVEPVRNGNGNGNGAAAPRPPAWAGDAPVDVRKRVVTVLGEVLGDEGTAKQYARALADACDGAFPVVVGRWLTSLPDWRTAAAKTAESRERAAAQVAKRQQDADAERPDEEPMTPERAAERARDRAAAAEPYAEDGVSPRADDPRYQEDEPPAEALVAGATEPDLPPAGSVDNPFAGATELDEEAIGQLRELGCVCPDPTVEVGRTDECPIKGHGIPF